MRGHCFVNGVEKHVKCAYVGVNGKAQYIMKPPGIIKYGGNIEPLTDHKRDTSASINESYTIFASGFIPKSKNDSSFTSGITKLKTADAYDNKYYTKTKCSDISNTWRYEMFGLKLSKYALFIGGCTRGNASETKYMDAYDDSLVHTSSSTFLTYKTYTSHTGGSSPVINDTYAIIPAQSSSQKSIDNKHMIGIDTNLTVSNLKDRPITIRVECVGHVKDYALFGCGDEYSDGTEVTEKSMIAYNTSLTQMILPDMNYSYYSSTKSANAGDSIIFFGDILSGNTAPIDAYNNNLTKMSIAPPDYYKKNKFAYAYISGTIKNHAFFGGSNVSYDRGYTSTIYDENLIKLSGPTVDTWTDDYTNSISNNIHLMATGGLIDESPYAANTVSSYIMSDGYIP